MNLNLYRNFLLFFLICNVNFSQKNMNLDVIKGIKKPDLVGDSIMLEKNTYKAFKKMESAAEKDGINLKIVSAYRGYDRQKLIWNKKYNKFTDEYSLNPMDAINEIIRFSTIPGTSRHHWGTDIDIIDGKYPDENNVLMSEKYEKGGIFYDLKKWLSNNSEKFGFFLTYNNDPKRKGFEYEPWHYSYKPSSKKYLKLLLISEFIMDINPDLK
jgi:LAS superfamily LD-carboxypeptidase LdcB